MKTVVRILAILVAITAVAWGTYALGQTSWFTQQFADGPGERDRISERDGEDVGQPGLGLGRGNRSESGGEFEGRGRDRAAGFNLLGVTEFARTLLPMALVITAVVLLSKLADTYRKRKKNANSPPNESAAHT